MKSLNASLNASLSQKAKWDAFRATTDWNKAGKKGGGAMSARCADSGEESKVKACTLWGTEAVSKEADFPEYGKNACMEGVDKHGNTAKCCSHTMLKAAGKDVKYGGAASTSTFAAVGATLAAVLFF